MIVISHPWEFVPKGSSHLNYHTNSIDNKAESKAFTAGHGAGSEGQIAADLPFGASESEAKGRILQAQRKNIKLELNNSSLVDYSLVYLQKNAPFNMNSVETQVTVYGH